LSRWHRDDLAHTDDLVLRIKAWGVKLMRCWHSAVCLSQRMLYTVLGVLRVWRDEDPVRTGRAARARWIRFARPEGMRVRSTARPGRSSFIDDHVAGFIDDHVAGADQPVELSIVEIANCSGDRRAGPKQLLWSVEDRARCLP
jgi:hypothetical protein